MPTIWRYALDNEDYAELSVYGFRVVKIILQGQHKELRVEEKGHVSLHTINNSIIHIRLHFSIFSFL